MKIFRAIDVNIPNDLSGFGASVSSGTWHLKTNDIRMVYACENSSTCLLEKLANSRGILPQFLNMQEISGLELKDIENVRNLPNNWFEVQKFTQMIGVEWLKSHYSLALRVPSKVSYESFNILLNPFHESFYKLTFKSKQFETDIRFRGF